MTITHAQLLTLDPALNPEAFQKTYSKLIANYRFELAQTAANLLKAGLAAHAPKLAADLETLTMISMEGSSVRAKLMRRTVRQHVPRAEYSLWPLPDHPLEAQLQAALNVRLHLLKLREGIGTLTRDTFSVYSAVPVSALANLVLPARGDTRPLTVSLRGALAEVMCLYDLPKLADRILDLPEHQDVRAALNGHEYTLEDCLDFTPHLGRKLLGMLETQLDEVSVLSLEPEAQGLRSITAGEFKFCALMDGWLVTRNGEAIGLYPSALALLCTAKTEFGLLHDPVNLPVTLGTDTLQFEGEDELPLQRLMVTGDGVLDTENGRSYLLNPHELAGISAQLQRLNPA